MVLILNRHQKLPQALIRGIKIYLTERLTLRLYNKVYIKPNQSLVIIINTDAFCI